LNRRDGEKMTTIAKCYFNRTCAEKDVTGGSRRLSFRRTRTGDGSGKNRETPCQWKQQQREDWLREKCYKRGGCCVVSKHAVGLRAWRGHCTTHAVADEPGSGAAPEWVPLARTRRRRLIRSPSSSLSRIELTDCTIVIRLRAQTHTNINNTQSHTRAVRDRQGIYREPIIFPGI